MVVALHFRVEIFAEMPGKGEKHWEFRKKKSRYRYISKCNGVTARVAGGWRLVFGIWVVLNVIFGQ
jgi:hypothetical protein